MLSEEEQMIVYYHFGLLYSYKEIAQELGKSEEAIRQKGNRAKEKLKRNFPELHDLY